VAFCHRTLIEDGRVGFYLSEAFCPLEIVQTMTTQHIAHPPNASVSLDPTSQSPYFGVVSGVARFLSHSMGNPLAGLSLTLELLAASPLAESQMRLVERCLRVGERLSGIKENLGALGGACAGGAMVEVDCAEICQSVVASQRLAEPYDLSIEVLPGAQYVVAHPGLLADALGYLLRNSTDASPLGGRIGVRVSPRADIGDAGGVRFTVWDTGPGMPEAFLDRLFVEPVTNKRHAGGTGLMLVAMIVQWVHRGRISFEPYGGPGPDVEHTQADPSIVTGCRFHLDLPAHSA
jgi:signal transduction histidine kinase